MTIKINLKYQWVEPAFYGTKEVAFKNDYIYLESFRQGVYSESTLYVETSFNPGIATEDAYDYLCDDVTKDVAKFVEELEEYLLKKLGFEVFSIRSMMFEVLD